MRKLTFLFLCFFWAQTTVWGQEEKLPILLEEREQLTLEYEFYNKQNSNFWGKKSKKDLLQIIQTLKNIINKDSEIIREINTASLRKQAQVSVEASRMKNQVVDDQRLNQENLYQLRQDLASQHNLAKVKDRQLASLREDLQEARERRGNGDVLIAALGGLSLLLLLYILLLRRKMTAAKNSSRRKR
jgi:CRISPR/Cas system-associated endoribonuclease Cas2